MNEQIVGAQRKILREQVFRAGAGLLAVGSRHAWIRLEDGWAIPDTGATSGPPCVAANRLAAAFPSATCSKAREPFFSMARVKFART